MTQYELPTGRIPRPFEDLVGILGQGVYPTGDLYVLERNKWLLFIRRQRHNQEVRDVQRRIWRSLSLEPNCSVLCVWGGPGNRYQIRTFVDGVDSGDRPVSNEQFRQAVIDWWLTAGKFGR